MTAKTQAGAERRHDSQEIRVCQSWSLARLFKPRERQTSGFRSGSAGWNTHRVLRFLVFVCGCHGNVLSHISTYFSQCDDAVLITIGRPAQSL